MGRVIVPMLVENVYDLYDANRGLIAAEQVRRVEVSNALVDTGATQLGLPPSLIARLGIASMGTRRAITAGGVAELPLYGPVRVTIFGRVYNGDVMELPEESPALVGQIPLELLDFVVDVPGHRLIGNPAHRGEQMVELYSLIGKPSA